ncbi:MAG: N-acetylmuramoyl-L-alanine amidase, partial [Armatimonadetes bacterium]|nr:N-acetylmuramoyl-L-alanine amidase [Armatimonadota bacterium]
MTEEFHLGPGELAEGSRAGLTLDAGGLKLGRGRRTGHFLSPVLRSNLPFHYAGLFWSGIYPEGSSIAFWIRTSADGRHWTAWEKTHVEMPPGPSAKYDSYSSLVRAEAARYVQFLGEVRGGGKKPTLKRAGLILLNPYDGPVSEVAADASPDRSPNTAFAEEMPSGLDDDTGRAAAAASAKPVTFRREDWGAHESLRFSDGEEIWPRSYVPTKKLVVHHTATWNGYGSVEDAKAQVRAIYTYHAKSLGWGDIGYNCLIDKFGNSYEGRRGRDGPGYDGPGGREVLSEDVVAGHALAYNYGSSGIALLGTFCTPSECSGGSPTSAMISRLKDVLEWECRKHGLNPGATSDFLLHDGTWHRDLRNVVGHRDVSGTTCPGGNVYALLPTLRSDVAARLGSAGPSVSITSAPAEGTINEGEVEYTWKGSGGSGGLKYSYCLVGWSRISGSSEVNYLRGFDSRNSPTWGPWTTATKARLCYVSGGLYTFHIKVRDGGGQVGTYQGSRTFLGTVQTTICDGALLRGTGSAVYVMQKGLKRHVPNQLTFAAQGFLWGNVNRIPDSRLNAIPTGHPLLNARADGNLLRGTGSAVYVMQAGLKRHVTSPA